MNYLFLLELTLNRKKVLVYSCSTNRNVQMHSKPLLVFGYQYNSRKVERKDWQTELSRYQESDLLTILWFRNNDYMNNSTPT